MSAPRWTYKRIEKGVMINGHPGGRITHQILFDGKIIESKRGTDHLEGTRCKKIVMEANRDGVIHEPILVGADIPSAASRCSKISKAAIERQKKNNEPELQDELI